MTTGPGVQGAGAIAFSGEFDRSQLVVGDHNVLNRYEGTVVQVLQGPASAPRATERPQLRMPRPAAPPIGRDRELGLARRAMVETRPIEFWGPSGIGRSALLKQLARDPGTAWADGVLYARVAGQQFEDIVQWLFEVFWTSEPRWAPGSVRVYEYLRELRALLVLDDVEFDVDDVSSLLDAAGRSGFVLAGSEPRLDAAAETVVVDGLPVEAAVLVFEQCLRRSLGDLERAAVSELVARLDCVPALVMEAARLVRVGVCTLPDIARLPANDLSHRRLLGLTPAQSQVLATVAELSPAAVPGALLTGLTDAGEPDFQVLEDAGLIEANSPRFALTAPLSAADRELLPYVDPAPMLSLLAELASHDELVSEAAPAVIAALDWGSRAGALDAVVETARAVDGALLLNRRTGAWGAAIASGASAARARGRLADEAYFLHQQGTRWLCLADDSRAEEYLRRALAMREGLDDHEGVAATRHNLAVLRGDGPNGAPDGRDRGGGPHPRLGSSRLRMGAVALAAVILGVAAGTAVGSGGQPKATTITEPGKTVTDAGRTVTDAGKTVTDAGRTVTEPGTTVTTPPVTVTVSGPTVTSPPVTVTVTSPPPSSGNPAN